MADYRIETDVTSGQTTDAHIIETSVLGTAEETTPGLSYVEQTTLLGPPGAPGQAGADGGTDIVTAGQALSGHRVVRPQADGTVVYASNDDLADAGRPLWLTLNAANSGDPVEVRFYGLITEPSWSWTDGPVYLGTNGTLTQTPPSAPAAAFLVAVGASDGPTALFFDPRTPIGLS